MSDVRVLVRDGKEVLLALRSRESAHSVLYIVDKPLKAMGAREMVCLWVSFSHALPCATHKMMSRGEIDCDQNIVGEDAKYGGVFFICTCIWPMRGRNRLCAALFRRRRKLG